MDVDRDKCIVKSPDGRAVIRFHDANPSMSIAKDYYYEEFCKRHSKEDLIREAKLKYGTTSNPLDGFYLLDDGSLLNHKKLDGEIIREHGSITILYKDDPINEIFPGYTRHIPFIWRTDSIRFLCRMYRDRREHIDRIGINLEIWANINATQAQWSRLRDICEMLDKPKLFYDVKLQNIKRRYYYETFDVDNVKEAYKLLHGEVD